MRPNESGITRASMSHTIGTLNALMIFGARSSTDSITCDTIRKRSKAYSIPFFELDVELFMRGYIARGLLRFLQFLDFRPRRQIHVLSSSALGVKIVALRGFPHFRGVLAGLVDGLNEIRSPKEAIGWKDSHERPFTAG